ncbi:hypothetical protein B0H14DRAFT_3874942 [Mycena olivaceomarginata]|nr:hypothetical protein B0H14DRAFT_3874942 [Mycena olivaceomarginata]
MSSPDELTATVFALISAGQYGPDVENYLEVYMRTPDLPRNHVVKALLARGNAGKWAGRAYLPRPSRTSARCSNWTLLTLRSSTTSTTSGKERIVSFIPHCHLRTWLFVSAFHCDIAVRLIFPHPRPLFRRGNDQEALNRGLDVFDRAKADPVFASRVKSLRLHWAYEEGDMLDLMIRIFRSTLPVFKALRDFEWIGYPEMRAEMVQTILASHPHLHGLGLIGWHFDAIGVSSFPSLHKFTLRAEDDDGFAPMAEIRAVLDRNARTLRHLVLGAYLARHHSWDAVFQSSVIHTLTHLDLVDTRISQLVLGRVAHAAALVSLTLHGTFEDVKGATVIFAGDHVLDEGEGGGRQHTLLPHLHSFRFLLVGHDNQHPLYAAVAAFLAHRPLLRRLDLGSCPWELVRSLLPTLSGLKVLGVRIAHFNGAAQLNAEVRMATEK